MPNDVCIKRPKKCAPVVSIHALSSNACAIEQGRPVCGMHLFCMFVLHVQLRGASSDVFSCWHSCRNHSTRARPIILAGALLRSLQSLNVGMRMECQSGLYLYSTILPPLEVRTAC